MHHHSTNNYGKDKLLAVYKVQKAGLPTIGGSPGFFDLFFLREFAAYYFVTSGSLLITSVMVDTIAPHFAVSFTL